MASTVGTAWQESPFGSDLNGGCFDPSFGGTDMSLVDAPAITLTDLVTTSGSATAVSASGLFTAAMVGNGINVAGANVYQIVAVVSVSTVTLDRNVTTGASVQAARVGGAIYTPGFMSLAITQCSGAGNKWYQADGGTYPITNSTPNVANGRVVLAIGGAASSSFELIGHKYGNRADTSTTPVTSITFNNTAYNFSGGNTVKVTNISIAGNSNTATGIVLASGHIGDRIKSKNCNSAGFQGTLAFFFNCEADTCATGFTGRLLGAGNSAHNCTGVGFAITSGSAFITNCIAWACATGFTATSSITTQITHCTAQGCTGSGFSVTNGTLPVHMSNCLAYGNGAYGFTASTSSSNTFMQYCAGGSNTSGNVNANIVSNYNFVTLTASPFVNSAGLDFSINNVAGGGALLRNAGWPSTMPGSSTPGYADIGAVGHGSSAGGAVMVGSPMIRGVKY